MPRSLYRTRFSYSSRPAVRRRLSCPIRRIYGNELSDDHVVPRVDEGWLEVEPYAREIVPLERAEASYLGVLKVYVGVVEADDHGVVAIGYFLVAASIVVVTFMIKGVVVSQSIRNK